MVGKTKVITTHRLRRTARKTERELQARLDRMHCAVADGDEDTARWDRVRLDILRVPEWARGVRVEKAGLFSYACVATEKRGR